MENSRTIPSLDGIRTFAVLFVILCHTESPFLDRIPLLHVFRIGSLGVNLFFVISGFLITQLLLKEADKTGTISLHRFYLRRSWRIFPAFYVYLAVAMLLKLQHASLFTWTSLAGAATYTWNYNPLVDGWLLGHSWSLSLEEQFYLVWPPAIAFLSRRVCLRLAGLVILLSPLIRIATYVFVPSLRGRIDMMLHTHLDAIMLGCFLALAASLAEFPKLRARISSPWAAAAGALYAFYIAPILEARYRGSYYLTLGMTLTAFSCAAIILYAVTRSQSPLGRILNNPVVKHFGVISYSLYLWQQMFTGPYTRWFPFNVLLIVACAEASYWFIERPSLRLRDALTRPRTRPAPTAISSSAEAESFRPPAIGLIMPLAAQQGGAEVLFQSLLRSRPAHLNLICCFLQDGPLVQEARELGYEVYVFPTTHLSDVPDFVATVKSLRNFIRRRNPSLVFSWMLKGHLYAVPASLGFPVKTMWFQHGLSKRHWMDFAGAWCPADGILCCSSYAKLQQDQHFPTRPSFVCHPGIPLRSGAIDDRALARQQLDLPQHAQIVGMVARLERWKGAHIFIEAAREVLSKRPEAFFFLVGGPHPLDPEYAAQIRIMTQHPELGGRFRLAGQRSASEVPLWHVSADLIVHPATEPEPFGMAIAEAMAAGRLVVASNTGGPAEIIEDHVSGSLIPPADSGALAQAILHFLEDAPLRHALEAQAVVRSRMFSIDAFVARFESLVARTLKA